MFDLDEFSKRNRTRCESEDGFSHPLSSWSLSDWMTATLGELGEAANIVKKLNRYRDGIPGNNESIADLNTKLADEIADAFIYLDLLAQAAGVYMPVAVASKFARTSAKIGYLEVGPTQDYPEGKMDESDEGGLNVAIGWDIDKSVVRIEFGKRIAWLGLEPAHAVDFAKAILKHAGAKKIEVTL